MNGPPRGNGAHAPAFEAEGFAPQDLYQKREKIYTRYAGGFFQRLRFFTGWPLLLGYFALPWLQWGDRQAVLFDLPARQFHVLGATFWPQDFWLLGWLLIIAAFALFTVTTVVGRLWCGYTCPQTVWTAIFMWVEQLVEGPRHVRIRLDAAPLSAAKVGKRTLKHGLWLGWAAFTGLTFVGYFTPIRELAGDLVRLDVGGWAAFWIAFFTLATYVNAGWLREQVCIYMCPYARFQSAMFDRDTLIVSYDASRGEPRGARKRNTAPGTLGDCVDCRLCVQVCPTGIDIRNGLQYECIGCAHCVDACDQIMDKMGYPRGLIRYTTEHALNGAATRWARPRAIGYAVALAAIGAAFVWALAARVPLEIDVLRERGALYHESGGVVRNSYQLKLMNMSQAAMTLDLAVTAPAAMTASVTDPIVVQPGEVLDQPLTLTARREDLPSSNLEVGIRACARERTACAHETSRFLGPAP